MSFSHRTEHLYYLCAFCTVLMLSTSVVNIISIVRRPSSVVSSSTSISVALIRSEQNQTKRFLTKTVDPFEQTYRIFLQNYVSIVDEQNSTLNYCPAVPPNLLGPISIEDLPTNFSLENSSSFHVDVENGGSYRPKECQARHKVALIVPYRNRWQILSQFLFHTHKILQRQQLDYHIYVCEQAFNKTFNKGIVMNGCFKEILRAQPDIDCVIMHDVDLLMIDDRNMYSCPTYPRHLSVAIDKFQFYLPYAALVGGVLAMRRQHYLLVNGYSTNYWGWGGEDDDMYERIINKHLPLERPPASVARYKMLKHTHQELNPERLKILKAAHTRIDSDGVNNVKYRLLEKKFYHLFTHLLIDVGEEPK